VGRRFQTTRWSLVLQAGASSAPESREALSHLYEAYWYPLYAYVRRQGFRDEDARDLTQAYFLTVMQKDYLRDVRRDVGRFRSFLRASVRHFLSKERDRARTLKRGGNYSFTSLEMSGAQERYTADPRSETDSPESLFDRRWAITVLERALDRLEEEFAEAGKAEQFRGFRSHLTGEGRTIPYAELAEWLGSSEGAVKVAVHRSRRRFGEILRAEIAETVARPEDVDDEVHYLLEVLQSA
jgi:RNA polymerase sigma-70 factor (ECF subfamily)